MNDQINNNFEQESTNTENESVQVKQKENPKKELKKTTSECKEFKKVLKIINSDLNALEKWEQKYKKIKINKDLFKNYEGIFQSINNITSILREEKYNFETRNVENNKKIDELKDKLKK